MICELHSALVPSCSRRNQIPSCPETYYVCRIMVSVCVWLSRLCFCVFFLVVNDSSQGFCCAYCKENLMCGSFKQLGLNMLFLRISLSPNKRNNIIPDSSRMPTYTPYFWYHCILESCTMSCSIE